MNEQEFDLWISMTTKLGDVWLKVTTDNQLEIDQADEYAFITVESLEIPIIKDATVRDGPFIFIKGAHTEVCYEILNEDYASLTYFCKRRAVRL